jgi:hypothetical protein
MLRQIDETRLDIVLHQGSFIQRFSVVILASLWDGCPLPLAREVEFVPDRPTDVVFDLAGLSRAINLDEHFILAELDKLGFQPQRAPCGNGKYVMDTHIGKWIRIFWTILWCLAPPPWYLALMDVRTYDRKHGNGLDGMEYLESFTDLPQLICSTTSPYRREDMRTGDFLHDLASTYMYLWKVKTTSEWQENIFMNVRARGLLWIDMLAVAGIKAISVVRLYESLCRLGFRGVSNPGMACDGIPGDICWEHPTGLAPLFWCLVGMLLPRGTLGPLARLCLHDDSAAQWQPRV